LGFPGLDAAMDCVLGQLEFVAGRRDGRAVEAMARLPIVFRLHRSASRQVAFAMLGSAPLICRRRTLAVATGTG
jgi:hypothetical protein